jgi:hypothetical protein
MPAYRGGCRRLAVDAERYPREDARRGLFRYPLLDAVLHLDSIDQAQGDGLRVAYLPHLLVRIPSPPLCGAMDCGGPHCGPATEAGRRGVRAIERGGRSARNVEASVARGAIPPRTAGPSARRQGRARRGVSCAAVRRARRGWRTGGTAAPSGLWEGLLARYPHRQRGRHAEWDIARGNRTQSRPRARSPRSNRGRNRPVSCSAPTTGFASGSRRGVAPRGWRRASASGVAASARPGSRRLSVAPPGLRSRPLELAARDPVLLHLDVERLVVGPQRARGFRLVAAARLERVADGAPLGVGGGELADLT